MRDFAPLHLRTEGVFKVAFTGEGATVLLDDTELFPRFGRTIPTDAAPGAGPRRRRPRKPRCGEGRGRLVRCFGAVPMLSICGVVLRR